MTDFVVHGLVDNSYFLPDMAIVFWLTVFVVAAAPSVAGQGGGGRGAATPLLGDYPPSGKGEPLARPRGSGPDRRLYCRTLVLERECER